MAAKKYDVCVIGSGAAGGALAASLARQGASVALIEAGPYRDPAKLNSHRRPYDRRPLGVPPVRVDPDKEPYEVRGDRIAITRGRVFGGRTTHWNAVSLRFSADDFREWSVNGIEEDWPISYDELAPYYDRAERLMVVCGSRENLEVLPDGEFIRPLRLRCSERIMQGASTKLGIRLIPVRKALATEVGHGRAACHYCGHCMDGCGVSAIYNVAEHVIPAGQETGRLETRIGWMACEIITDEAGRARSVRIRKRYQRDEDEVRAEVFAVCCGNIESPRLLLNSTSRRFPNGLANNADNVGRYLTGHIVADTHGYLRQMVGRRPFNQDGAIDHAYIPRFKPYREIDYAGGFGFQVNVRPYDYPHHARRLEGYGGDWKRRVRTLQPAHSMLSGYGKVMARRSNRVTLHPARRDANDLPIPVVAFRWHDNDLAIYRDMLRTAREIYDEAGVVFRYHPLDRPNGFASHEVGAARMGKDPKTSVLNSDNQAHEVPNLFVVDGSCFTTFPEKNPTLTITALALRAADRIMDLSRRREI